MVKAKAPPAMAVVLAGLLPVLAACGATRSTPSVGKVNVVASFYPLAEFAAQVGGERVDVRSLAPAGVEPHDWEPSAAALTAIAKAQVFLYNGGGFDPWADRIARENPKPEQLVIKANEAADTGTSPDPHFWLDPVQAARLVQRLGHALTEADPAGRTVYEANAAAYAQRLQQLHQRYEQGVQECGSRTFITAHSAFGHLASRYNLEAIGVSGLSPQAEPSPGKLAELVRLAREKNVRYVFFEGLVSPRVAETIAREVGAATLELNPIEGLTSAQAIAGENYVTLMEHNLDNLRIALECR